MKYAFLFFSIGVLISCDLKEVFTKPTAREIYERTLSSEDLVLWKAKGQQSFLDEVTVRSPYSEQILVNNTDHIALGYLVECDQGEILNVHVNSTNFLIGIYEISSDSLEMPDPILDPNYLSEDYHLEIKSAGSYFIRVQSKFGIQDTLDLGIFTSPALKFPVSGGKNADIGSFWGDPRDGGKRKHKGIDIFAKKGTPLVATTASRVRSVRNRGLGGKQIWLYDSKRNLSIYYAHLDSQYVKQGISVDRGDTIGTVGNSGNARTTPPHLHFGIYVTGSGAIDPLTFVQKQKGLRKKSTFKEVPRSSMVAKSNNGTFRQGPSNNFDTFRGLEKGEQFTIIGISGQWYHVRDFLQIAGFVHSSNLIKDTPS